MKPLGATTISKFNFYYIVYDMILSKILCHQIKFSVWYSSPFPLWRYVRAGKIVPFLFQSIKYHMLIWIILPSRSQTLIFSHQQRSHLYYDLKAFLNSDWTDSSKFRKICMSSFQNFWIYEDQATDQKVGSSWSGLVNPKLFLWIYPNQTVRSQFKLWSNSKLN